MNKLEIQLTEEDIKILRKEMKKNIVILNLFVI